MKLIKIKKKNYFEKEKKKTMKKLLSLTTMAMIALTTPTLNVDTTANTTKEVKKSNVAKTVDYFLK